MEMQTEFQSFLRTILKLLKRFNEYKDHSVFLTRNTDSFPAAIDIFHEVGTTGQRL